MLNWDLADALILAFFGVAILLQFRVRPTEQQRVLEPARAATLLSSALMIFIGVTIARVLFSFLSVSPLHGAILGQVPALIAVLALCILRTRHTTFRWALNHPTQGALKQTLLGVVTYLVFLPSILLLHQWSHSHQADPTVEQASVRLFRSLMEGGTLVPVFLLGAVVVLLVPLFEEWIFRGLLQGGFQSLFAHRMKARAASIVALVLTAGLFMAVHEPFTWATIFCLALILGALRLGTQGLWAPVAFHVCHNLTTLLVLYLSAKMP